MSPTCSECKKNKVCKIIKDALVKRKKFILDEYKQKTGIEIGCVVSEYWQGKTKEFIIRDIVVDESLDCYRWNVIGIVGSHKVHRRHWGHRQDQLVGEIRLVRTKKEEKEHEEEKERRRKLFGRC